MHRVIASLILFFACVNCRPSCSEEATYRLLASCEWTNETHPTDYPSKYLHFSPLCGTVHNENYTLWRIGGKASPGVKLVSELGNCYVLEDEIEECEAEGSCQEESFFEWTCNSEGDNPTICSFEGNLTVSEAYSKVSMMSMLAPSPDWNVGIDSLDLCQEDEEGVGRWLDSYPLNGTAGWIAWDAGTDDGETYTSNNVPLKPFDPIRWFDTRNASNIFFNRELEALLPICQVSIERLE